MNNRKGQGLRREIAFFLSDYRADSRSLVAGIANFSYQVGNWNHVFIGNFDMLKELGQSGRRFDGLIGQLNLESTALDACKLSKILVNIEDPNPVFDLPRVEVDQCAVGRLAANYLLALGFRQFAFLGLNRFYFSRQREKGFCETLEKKGRRHVIRLQFTGEEAACQKMLGDLPKPIAILAACDGFTAIPVANCLRLGIKIPEEIALLGVDNDDYTCHQHAVSVSSIALPYEEMGYAACDILNKLLEGRELPDKTVVLQPQGVVARESTDIHMLQDWTVNRALQFIRRNAHRPFSVAEVAEDLKISRRNLERRFGQMLGRPVSHAIKQARVERAKRLLSETNLSVEEIAYYCGFNDSRMFRESFKKIAAAKPLAYRKKTAGE